MSLPNAASTSTEIESMAIREGVPVSLSLQEGTANRRIMIDKTAMDLLINLTLQT
jgi:hypothetical protein